MAKATKSDAGDKPGPKKKEPAAAKKAPAVKEAAAAAPAAKQAPVGQKSAKSAKAAAATGSGAPPVAPRIDTGLAAAAAASMIANRAVAGFGTTASQGGGAPDPAAKPESSSFKSLKEGLSKPPVGGLGAILGAGGGSKTFNQGFGGPKPSVPGGAKNQTFGADVNRAGVPRRTGG